jgi:hypothetical protein
MFKRINANLKAMGLQIRSLSILERVVNENDADNDTEDDHPADSLIRVLYHGIVNLEDDFTAEKFGTNLKPEYVCMFIILLFCSVGLERLLYVEYFVMLQVSTRFDLCNVFLLQ